MNSWNPGLGVALANSEEEARALLLAQAEDYNRETMERDLAVPPEVHEEPVAFWRYGSE